VEEKDSTLAVDQLPEATVAGWKEVEREVLGAQINGGVRRWGGREDRRAALRTRSVFTLIDSIVAGDDRARVESLEAPEEAAVGDDATPALARARGTDKVERRGEAQQY
jgi:hypothetical protein